MDKKTHFIELYSKNQKKIFIYILSMVHRQSDAEDILQQTSVQMWNKFNEFENGTSFLAWARAFAKFNTLDFKRKQQNSKLYFGEDIYKDIAEEMSYIDQTFEQRKNALQGCLIKLNSSDRKLLNLHYEKCLNYRQIAEKLSLSKTGIYKVMSRIHTNLHICIKRTLMVWEFND